ncbi:mandelate racemase/muconate lactonizing enzyme family protein [Paraburkholderia caballeronis]|uniref:mandelate racemase/muconate lactonizing enzyme family protein n=1 Tax=Paraburkholderia caballeronis TaxID=416943 RepID=UPI001066377F|nr:mandelate racemase/muconate lactonizing enzyme family protein [Paraburkholderia caballeronis]TDV06139.1 L-alanine-DL-glutamate epimerase-like enolase superfamily enzyme [Paraburkholderia caballeronis]TDV09679.1 L-alanine-DL-glutamate epimerase-like enolase superfamily enzyme [Paraburkholderia caballeronis]TDV21744.1 L-alanine-DL-glutamate epimerase-like enolase superfamily enzyme [Paraburkholderia caballeronis]
MKITALETLHADAGWYTISFVKLSTDEGLVGWSEYRTDAGNAGLTAVIEGLGRLLVGADPRQIEQIDALLRARTRQAPGGLNSQAVAALLNALFDVKAHALGVPVSALFGGQVRTRIPLYWSHCGSYRLRHAQVLGVEPVRTLDDIVRLGAEVRQRGFGALKASILLDDQGQLRSFGPGFGWSPGFPELNVDRQVLQSVDQLLAAFREGAGNDVMLMLDANCHFRPEGAWQIARAVAPHDLTWLEIDLPEPAALAAVRRAGHCPVASCEAVYGRRALRSYLDQQAVDVAIIDVNWNGFLEAVKMASLADSYDVNVATHSYGGCLGECISAQFAAAVPNLRIMEIDVDHVPWAREFVTHPPVIEDGVLVLSDRPGWGTGINEEAVRAYPPARR